MITKKPYHESTYVAKKSKFVCKIATISNSHEAMKFVKDHSDFSVSHNCFAWRIGDANNRSSDDGEPSGTAGIPILNVLHGKKEKLDFENVVAMVDEDTGGVSLELNVDFDAIEELESALNEATSGRVDFKWFDS